MTPGACLLLLGGEVPDRALVRAAAKSASLLVCADGGARHALSLGWEPRFVVGDMDSLPKPLPHWGRTTYWCDFSEEISDFEKALLFCREIGCPRVYVAGVLGGRLDHALVNMALAEKYGASLELVLLDHGAAELVGPGQRRLPLRKGETFSLVAAGGDASVTLAGARYPLRRAKLARGSRGLSNEAKGPVSLTVHSGGVWLARPAGLL